MENDDKSLGPWNPGLQSRLPAEARPLSTIYRAAHCSTTIEVVDERAAFTGLEPETLVTFRPERLIVHELLIRVTGDFSVPDGNRYADLGINFRTVTDTILKGYICPQLDGIVQTFNDLKASIVEDVEAELRRDLFSIGAPVSQGQAKGHWLQRWLGLDKAKPKPSQALPSQEERERQLLERWRRQASEEKAPRRRRTSRALAQILGAISIKHGQIRGDLSLLVELVTDRVMNDHGSAVIGELLQPLISEAVVAEGYLLLPRQDEPVVMNVKGASAAGKSTLRPLQRHLAERLGIDWADFALISPDIWRKYLLDYDSLGEYWRYAGTLTGHELQIIDQKLDRYMAAKAEQQRMSHLLIDRFRFDSFAEKEGGEQGARLLTRFGSSIYMFFVITPPDATVERAWKRGLEFGRFKAVDDLLDHNVEAFTGMPELFFTWALRQDKRVYFEFLDNSVPAGETPRTVAFGWNGDMTILDLKALIDVDRYKRIDVGATSPDEVYPEAEMMRADNNTAFLKQCLKLIHTIHLTAPGSDRVMARTEGGKLAWFDLALIDAALEHSPDIAAGIAVLAPKEARRPCLHAKDQARLDRDGLQTLGQLPTEG